MDSSIIVALIVAIGPFLIGMYNIYQSKQIHYLVNSNLTKVKTDLALALSRVSALEKLLRNKEK